MPVQTRSAARKLQTEAPCDDQPPQHNSTLQGMHTRWIQPSEQDSPTSQPMLPIDISNKANRFQTPLPMNVNLLAVPVTPMQPRHSQPRRFPIGQQVGSVSPLGDVVMDFKTHTGADRGKDLTTEFQRRQTTENTPPPNLPVSWSSSTQNGTSHLQSPFGGWRSPGQESLGRLFLEAASDT